MGDVLLTEPVVRALRQEYDHVTICTDYPRMAALLGVYDEIIPGYERRSEIIDGQYDRVIELLYEIYPGINHLQGYARCAGIELARSVPRIHHSFPRIIEGPYGFIAPDTSFWIRSMREWPRERFEDLATRLEQRLGLPFVFLEQKHTFEDMLSLAEHCELFVGNDSGPAHLAQCFDRPTFVIFGATRPDLVPAQRQRRRDHLRRGMQWVQALFPPHGHRVRDPDVSG
jgi:ADP-heptose:LPS heptosyltransferase